MNINYLFFIFSCRYSYCTSRNSFYLCTMFRIEDFLVDEIYGERLLISKQADQTELVENIRVARVLLGCFADMNIRINEHLLVFCHKNPEYTINEKLGDRKGIEIENGI